MADPGRVAPNRLALHRFGRGDASDDVKPEIPRPVWAPRPEQERRSAGQPGPVASGGMELTLRNTFLEIEDHEAALAFYRDTLGLEVRQDVAMEFGRWVTV